MKVFILGAGKVGQYMAATLAHGHVDGFSLGGVWNRTSENITDLQSLLSPDRAPIYSGFPLPDAIKESTLLLIAVKDSAVLPVLEQLYHDNLLLGHHVILHTCGSRSIPVAEEVLDSIGGFGTIHPLLSIATPPSPAKQDRLSTHDAGFLVAGSNSHTLQTASALAKGMGGIPILAGQDTDRATYHAAACMASSLSVTLIMEAAAMISRATGLALDEALPLTMKLTESAMCNLATLGFPDGVTGPAMRQDLQTMDLHMDALSEHPQELELYKRLSDLLAIRTASKS